MSYIGNAPTTAAFLTDTFSGNGGTTFTMSVAPANTTSIIVAITGVLQDPSTYSVSGTTLTFSAAPPTGTSNISVRYLGIPASGVTTTAYRTVTNSTATAGQTSFTIPSYTVGYVDVYRNGVYLPTTDYTATTGTTVVLTNAATVGDTITTVSFYVSSVLNAIPATASSVSDSYIVSMAGSKLTGTQVIPKATLPTGSILQVVNASIAGSTTTSSTYVDSGVTATITPTSSTSKILVIVDLADVNKPNVSGAYGKFQLVRTSTSILVFGGQTGYNGAVTQYNTVGSASLNYLDSPATTSATTYKVQFSVQNGGTLEIGASGSYSTITLMEISA